MERLQLIAGHLTAGTNGNAFGHVKAAPADPIFGLKQLFNKDSSDKKVDLVIGAYRTDEGKPYVFSAVRKAEKALANDNSLNKEYLPISGHAKFCKLARELMFGTSSPAIRDNRIVTAQTVSGTGSLRVVSEFLLTQLGQREFLLPNRTWANHGKVFEKTGWRNVKKYTYYDPKKIGLDFDGMIRDLKAATPGSVVLLHACAHNPTGVDPTPEQWRAIADVMEERQLFPFIDCAYQGFASGDLDQDAYSIRLFVERGFQIAICQSFAKNMGLYGERTGACHFVVQDASTAKIVQSQLNSVIRPMCSNCPIHGARIAAMILGDSKLRAEWTEDLKAVSGRILEMRKQLHHHLVKNNTPGNWDHILSQIGMFSFTGLSQKACDLLINEKHVYLMKNGRMSMAGLTSKNVAYVAQCMKEAIEATQ